MIYRGTSGQGYSAQGRPSLLLPVVLLHVAVLAWVASEQVAAPTAHPGSGLKTFDVEPVQPLSAHPPTPRTAVRPPPIEVPSPPPPVAEPLAALPVAAVESMPLAMTEGGCDLTDTVQSALRSSESARAALAALPARARSVANAIMLWDGQWIDPASAADRRALVPVQDVVRATVRAASADCRTQLQAGPRLIVMPGPPDVVLALGSGRWRWDDLDRDEGQNAQIAVQSAKPAEADGTVTILP